MKANTHVFAAFRNIGDAQDSGQEFNGPLKEVIMWLATRMGATNMATRIVIGIGRDESGARAGVELKRGYGAKLDAAMFGDALDALLDGESPDLVLSSVAEGATSVDPRDTYKGPIQ